MVKMIENKEIMQWLNKEIIDCIPAADYANKLAEEIIEHAYQNTVQKVYTTFANELGLASPDLINHRVIGGAKRGKVIKKIPEGRGYCEIGYDSDDKPLYFKQTNTFGNVDTKFIFLFEDTYYAMNLERIYSGKVTRTLEMFPRIIKFRYDEKGRIAYYAHQISIPVGGLGASIIANEYKYPSSEAEHITCHRYYYVTNISQDGKVIEGSRIQLSDTFYEISSDYKTITEYKQQKDGEFVFSRKIESASKKSAKSSVLDDNYRKFEAWLDSQLEMDIPTEGGVYFDLFGPNEDGFGIYFDITEDFTPNDDDWACYVVYASENMFMVNTNDEMKYDKATKEVAKLIKKYLKEGKNKAKLKKYKGIGTAFPSADIVYI